MNCPVCHSIRNTVFDEDKFRKYILCGDCQLVFVPRDAILPFEAEAQRYEAHNNDEDHEYREYLSKIVEAIRPLISKDARGLDFGCGKTTLIAKIFSGFGIAVNSYDLYFHPRQQVFEEKYDFIILSEVIEHLSKPLEVLQQLKSILKPHGQIFIKTKLYPPDQALFHQWFYKRDQTHVQFFNYESLNKLAGLISIKGPKRLALPDLYSFSL